jgi:hypothetical protein
VYIFEDHKFEFVETMVTTFVKLAGRSKIRFEFWKAWIMTSTVFLIVALCIVRGTFRSNLLLRVEGGCSRYLRNVSEFIRVHTASHPKRQYFSDVSVFCQFRQCIVCRSVNCPFPL